MKRNLTFALVLCILTLVTLATSEQSSSASNSNTAQSSSAQAGSEQEVLQAQKDYAEALTRKDAAALDRVWSDDYVFINGNGEEVSKAQRMQNMKSGATSVDEVRESGTEARVYGNFAVLNGDVELKAKYSGKESSGRYKHTSVWRKQNGRWQMLTNQITRIAATQ
jgi:ketosteroid isomerase-like protein